METQLLHSLLRSKLGSEHYNLIFQALGQAAAQIPLQAVKTMNCPPKLTHLTEGPATWSPHEESGYSRTET